MDSHATVHPHAVLVPAHTGEGYHTITGQHLVLSLTVEVTRLPQDERAFVSVHARRILPPRQLQFRIECVLTYKKLPTQWRISNELWSAVGHGYGPFLDAVALLSMGLADNAKEPLPPIHVWKDQPDDMEVRDDDDGLYDRLSDDGSGDMGFDLFG
jgi:hypothetical protein